MVKRSIFSHFTPFVALLWGGAMLPLAVAGAEVPLNQAVVHSLKPTAALSPNGQATQPASVQATLAPGEALSTARAAMAELRFDDGSLARVGGQALVRFASKSRTFQLSNGTMLLLVPPERGQTRIQTPNAVASVRGSALFVRYVSETNSTLVGALASDVEIANSDHSQAQMLGAGQLAVINNNRLEPAYRFDLKTFYETSALAKGLNLQLLLAEQRSGAADGAIEAIRTEAAGVIQKQTPLCTDSGLPLENGLPLETTQPARGLLRHPEPASTANCRSVGTAQTAPANQPDAALAQPTIALPATMPATLALPATMPPTLALPTTIPLVNPLTAIAPAIPVVSNAPSPPERLPLLNPNPNPPNPNPPNPNPPDPAVNNNVTTGP